MGYAACEIMPTLTYAPTANSWVTFAPRYELYTAQMYAQEYTDLGGIATAPEKMYTVAHLMGACAECTLLVKDTIECAGLIAIQNVVGGKRSLGGLEWKIECTISW